MSRKILFKAKRKNWRELPKEEQWVYGYYVSGFNIYEEQVYIIFDPTSIFYSSGETDGWDEIDPDTLCQFTEQTSQNETMFWEHDIVKYEDDCDLAFGIIKYENCNYTCGFYIEWCSEIDNANLRNDLAFWIKEGNLEVIGNFFDNPELLKGSDQE